MTTDRTLVRRSLLLAVGLLALVPGAAAQDRAEANRALVRGAYEALGRGDVAAVLAVMDPHVVWVEPAGSPYAGRHLGPGTVAAHVFARFAAEWDGYEVVPRAFVAQGDHVVVLGDSRGIYRPTGERVASSFAHVWYLLDGRVVSVRQFTDGTLLANVTGG
jgi:ketosteroid isomerase-like protein